MNQEYKFFIVCTDRHSYKIIKKNGGNKILISYFYLRKSKSMKEILASDNETEFLIDSGLFSYYSGANGTDRNYENLMKYFDEYINFVKENCNRENIKGFFELDFDLCGLDYHTQVKSLQKRLLDITNKIILICQKGRTMEDIEEMCKQNVETIAIPFASNIERKWFDYHLIIDLAHKNNKRVHLLGCATSKYCKYAEQSDSSTWIKEGAYGREFKIFDNDLKCFHWTATKHLKDDDEMKINKDDYKLRTENNCRAFIQFDKLINEMKKIKEDKQQRLF